MKTRSIAILAASAVLLVGGMFAVAQRVMQKGFSGGRGPMMALRQLNLTDDQQAKVKSIFEANRTNIAPLMQAMKANRQKLEAMNGAFDESQVSAIAKDQGDLMAKMIVARQQVKSQVMAILTDDQKAKAAQLHDQMKQRFQDRKKNWGQRTDGAKSSDDE
jgi:protein CpxP